MNDPRREEFGLIFLTKRTGWANQSSWNLSLLSIASVFFSFSFFIIFFYSFYFFPSFLGKDMASIQIFEILSTTILRNV